MDVASTRDFKHARPSLYFAFCQTILDIRYHICGEGDQRPLQTNSGMNPAFEKHDVNEAITPSHTQKIEAICITGRDRPPGDKTNRQVRFRPAHYTTFIDSEETSETLKELKTLVWYQSAAKCVRPVLR